MTVIRGKARGGGAQLATYLSAIGENDQIPRLVDIRGTAAPGDLRKSLLEMSLTAELTKTDKGLWHLQLNPMPGEDTALTDDDWKLMADITERHLGLEGQKRVMVEHVKNGRRHLHVAWERYDHEKEKIIDIKYSRLKQRSAVREIELTMGLKLTPLKNISEKDIKVALTALWTSTGGGAGFVREAARMGYTVTSGVDRPFKVLDDTGRSFDLVRQLEGVRTKDVRESFKHLSLQTEKAARGMRNGQKAMDEVQDRAAHRIEQFREERATERAKKQSFKETLSDMKSNNPGMFDPPHDKTLTEKGEAFQAAIDQFKTKEAATPTAQNAADKLAAMQDNIPQVTQPPASDAAEAERERRLAEFREQLNRARNARKDRERGLER